MNPEYEKILPFLEMFTPDEILSVLKHRARFQLSFLRRKKVTHATRKQVEAEIKVSEQRVNALEEIK